MWKMKNCHSVVRESFDHITQIMKVPLNISYVFQIKYYSTNPHKSFAELKRKKKNKKNVCIAIVKVKLLLCWFIRSNTNVTKHKFVFEYYTTVALYISIVRNKRYMYKQKFTYYF